MYIFKVTETIHWSGDPAVAARRTTGATAATDVTVGTDGAEGTAPEQPAQSVTDASGGGAGKKLSTVAIHLDLHSSRRDLPQPPLDIPDEKPTEHI